MKLIRYPQSAPLKQSSVLTIGNFDGVHIGHQTLINQVTQSAQKNDLQSIVVTMQPLPFQYFNKKQQVLILTPFKHKFKLIEKLGVDKLCILNFNHKLAQYSAHDFIQKVLIDGLRVRHIIIGDDFRFGKNRSGNIDTLKRYCQPLGILVDSITTVSKNKTRISSTHIRKTLKQGEFLSVKQCLGRYYSIIGKVSKGQQLGRELDFPTINIKLTKRHVLIEGIFCVMVKFTSKPQLLLMGAASIGTRPTVGGTDKILEVHILDFNKQVYGQNVEVLFHHKLRNEVKFNTLSELKRHIKEDVIKTRLFFEENKLTTESLRGQ